MSGIIGHSMYAILGAKAALHRKSPLASLIRHHWSSYLAGAYLGCDVQTMPEAICVDTGQEVGYGTVSLDKSPLTGGEVRPYSLEFEGRRYRPREIHTLFYGRAHLTFGWSQGELGLILPWQHLPEYCAAVAEDALTLFGPGHRPLAYALGWMTHLVGDGLIKSIWPGATLDLLGSKYSAKNRPIQDLVTFHQVGREELGLDWPALLADLCETPVEPVQLHFMRIASPRGRLGRYLAEGWLPGRQALLRAVLAENRRYLNVYRDYVLQQLRLEPEGDGWRCREELQQATGGLSYDEMIQAAEKAQFRSTLGQIAEAIADLFDEIVTLTPAARRLPRDDGPSWAELADRWEFPAARS